MKKNPDNRRDNVDHLQCAINHTVANIEAAEEMIAATDCAQTKAELSAKNKRRKESLCNMQHEIQEEAMAKRNNYK